MAGQRHILDLIIESEPFRSLLKQVRDGDGDATVSQLCGSSRSALLAALMIESPGQRLIITPDDESAENIANDINEFIGERAAYHFPEWGVDPYQWRPPVPTVVGTRLEALRRLQDSSAFTHC